MRRLAFLIVALVARTAAAAPCVPTDGVRSFGWLGSELVTCRTSYDGVAACWTIERATGELTPRAGVHLPGVGYAITEDKLAKPNCLGDLCWPAPVREADRQAEPLFVAYHPDGKRVAIDTTPRVFVFDLATKKITSSFDVPLSNALFGMWFVGETRTSTRAASA